MIPRSIIDTNGVAWFVITDLVGVKLKDQDNLKSSCTSWLRRNLPTGNIKKINIKNKGEKKGRKYVCISSDYVLTLSTYETHIISGGDFRARWSMLPDRPSLTPEAKKELAWRHLYKWSLSEHVNKLKMAVAPICEMRAVANNYNKLFSERPTGTYQETLAAVVNACNDMCNRNIKEKL